MAEIKAGDTVRLKSGGPLMTVSSVGRDTHDVLRAWCDWFEGTKAHNGSFPVTSLSVENS